MDIAALFLCFLVYGFMGWFYESTLWAICEKKQFINRGFLLEPYCPIYGVISLMDWYLLSDIQNPLKIFIIAFLVCSFFEYTISWGLEKIFSARWWDYSNYPFNINGRISLYSSTLFGLLGLLLIKVVHPYFYNLFTSLPVYPKHLAASILACLFIADLLLTSINLLKLNKKFNKIYNEVSIQLNKPFDYLNDHKDYLEKNIVVKVGKNVLLKMTNINEIIKHGQMRIVNSINSFKSTKYNDLIQLIKKEEKSEEDNK